MPEKDAEFNRITNPLPQLVPQRVQKLKWSVGGMTWERREPLTVFGGPVNKKLLPLSAGMRQPMRPVNPGDKFGRPWGSWEQRWMRTDLPAPRSGERGRRHLIWNCHGEATVYFTGEPWAGLDPAHGSCPAPDRAGRTWIDVGLWQTGIWIPNFMAIGARGLVFKGAELGVRNLEAWKIDWDLAVLLDYMRFLLSEAGHGVGGDFGYRKPIESLPPLARRLLNRLNSACDAFDRGGLAALGPVLAGIYRDLPAEGHQPTASVIGHAHLDQVWLWPEAATEHKDVHTAATQLRLMEKYPEFKFTQSQPAMNRAIERREPRLASRIARRIREGRWEVTGALEVECDTNLPCGESLARSIVYSQRKFSELRGSPSTVCWIPDVFGYSQCLPQVLALGGIPYFYTTKMTWSQVTKFPYSSFVWRAGDGSEVVTHLCPTGYNGDGGISSTVNALREHRQADVHPETLLPIGYGDGGGGVTEEMIERLRRIRSLAGVPRARWSPAEDFFDRLSKVRADLPVYQGELYLEYHRGTYTTQGEFKRLHRAAERSLQAREAVRVATGQGPVGEKSWLRVLFSEFHDAIPGSSIGLVYKELNAELEGIAHRELGAAAAELGGGKGGLTAFNPVAIPRRVVVDPPGGRGPVLVELAGLERRRVTAGGHTAAPVKEASHRVLDNGIVRAAFDSAGRLAALTVDETPLEIGPSGLALYADEPAMFDAWDIDHHVLKAGRPASPVKLAVKEAGPLRAVLEGSAQLGKRSKLTIRYILTAASRWLKIEVAVDWRESHQLLKYHVRTGYCGRFARFGCPFGSIARPQQPGDQKDEAMWEVPGSRWAAVVREDGVGLAIVTEAKYGFSCRDGNLGVSLLRSPKEPDREADMGRHLIRFAVGRHEPATRGAKAGADLGDDGFGTAGLAGAEIMSTAAAAEVLFAPVLFARGSDAAPPFTLSETRSLTPSWVLPAENSKGYVIRMHETDGSAGTAVLRLNGASARPTPSVEYVDFLERSRGKVERTVDGTYRIAYRPYQIVSVRVI
jgi:alpha-mannosidase